MTKAQADGWILKVGAVRKIQSSGIKEDAKSQQERIANIRYPFLVGYFIQAHGDQGHAV